MSNWAAYKEKEIGLPVFKRAEHGIHFDKGKGEVLAEFTGKPVHYFDGKEYRAIDTKPLLRKDGSYGCAHSDVIIKPDGTVQVGEYYQKAALIYPGKISVDGDRIARPFSGGVQYMYITENGFRQEIVLEKMPDLKKVSALVDKVSGVLPAKYKASALSVKDSTTAELADAVSLADAKSLATYLEKAVYPVVVDPDFAAVTGATYYSEYGVNATYATARTTAAWASVTGYCGQNKDGSNFTLYRMFIKFDTSTIGAGSTVTQVNKKLVAVGDISTTDFDVVIKKCDWTADDPITRPDDSAYDSCLAADADDSIWRNTSGLSLNTQYTSGNLATAWINKTGVTYYGLMSSRDVAANEPAGLEYVIFATPAHATESYRPVLTVTYTAGASGNPFYYFRQQQ